ncbi:hypothetical protein OG613_47275 (plasmid) [Streptomyces sp. NBC_00015]|uniref:hypothetical protein n=1 Tax=Streptomyces sp. NBC_00015 TaxID=2903611 RepID=UPI002F915487
MDLIICNPVIDDIPQNPDRHPHESAAPSGCRWCGVEKREHMQRREPSAGCLSWERPTGVQILARMHARHAARITAAPTQYHASSVEATTWSYVSDTPATDEFCADCGDSECPRWIRTQERIEALKHPLRLQR